MNSKNKVAVPCRIIKTKQICPSHRQKVCAFSKLCNTFYPGLMEQEQQRDKQWNTSDHART